MSGTNAVLPVFATSPNTCGVMGLLQTGTIFDTTIVDTVSSLNTILYVLAVELENIPQSILDELSGFDENGLVTDLENMVNVTNAAFSTHLSTQIANLIQNLSIASTALSAHLGLMNSGCSLPTLAGSGTTPTNPYPAMQVFFASILGTGASLITTASTNGMAANAAVQALLTAPMGDLQGIADSITAYVGYIVAAGTGMTNLVTTENAAFVSVAADMLNFASTNSILNLYKNPCAALVIDAIASAALASYLASNQPVSG
jgi:hypothetical protein